MKKNIGIIGFGNMGRAIARQIKDEYHVASFDKDVARAKGDVGIASAPDVSSLVQESDIVLVAVKPQDFTHVLAECRTPSRADKLFISIAAGITTAFIEQRLGPGARVVRVMPNMPAQVGAGVSCLAKGTFASEEDLDAAEDVFEFVGETQRVDESMMNAVTAVSGSGPAYVCWFLEKNKLCADSVPAETKQGFIREFAHAATAVGFSAEDAMHLVSATTDGTLKLLIVTGIAPAELRMQVTSKGGTTYAALSVLEQGGTLGEAVKAAAARAAQLAQG